jgi:hypothetical protein
MNNQLTLTACGSSAGSVGTDACIDFSMVKAAILSQPSSLSLSNILREFVPINDRQLTLIHYPSSIWALKRKGMGITSMHLSPLPLPLKPSAGANCLHVIDLILPVFPMLIKSRPGKLQSIIIVLLSYLRFACGLKPVASSECFISLLFQCKTPPHEYPI